ncbi:uncharacterized [Tachysurus ichikawai]
MLFDTRSRPTPGRQGLRCTFVMGALPVRLESKATGTGIQMELDQSQMEASGLVFISLNDCFLLAHI